jgi:hypothetical protein
MSMEEKRKPPNSGGTNALRPDQLHGKQCNTLATITLHMMGSRWGRSLVISSMITVREIVRRHTPGGRILGDKGANPMAEA